VWENGKREKLTLRTANGEKIRLKSLGKAGAEGELYEVEGSKDLVAKVYNFKEVAEKKRKKVEAMVEFFNHIKIAYPLQFNFFLQNIMLPRARLYTSDNEFCGFLMNRVPIEDCLSLGNFIRTKYREYTRPTDYAVKIVALERLTEIVEKLNRLNVVVGDLNYGNVFICRCSKRNIRAVIVDVDSFQFNWKGKTFVLDGIHPDIIAPELLEGKVPTVRTDSFVLGILFFRVLMKGFSPFQYIPEQEGDDIIEERIKNGRNVFNTGKPPSGLPSLELLGKLKPVIERVLHPNPYARPSTTEILTVVRLMKEEIKTCPNGHFTIPSTEGRCLFCGRKL
jgi:DNA-binding helix-hairpin-helix protein with protein kinase domain